MTHYLKSKSGNFKFEVEMGCNHPNMKNNTTKSISCNGKCEECNHSIATMTIPVALELIKRADCNYID